MIDQYNILVVAGGGMVYIHAERILQKEYDFDQRIMTQQHFQWDAEVYYDTTPNMSVHYSDTTYASITQLRSLKSKLHTLFKVFNINQDQKPIHFLSGNPTTSSDSVVESLSPLPTPFGDSDSLVEETDTLLSHFNDSSPDYETFCFDIKEKSSGSITSHSNHSLPEYESFCFDVEHIE
ncbi:hypothetical protein Tco_0352037 [Tanacetum coccineum]